MKHFSLVLGIAAASIVLLSISNRGTSVHEKLPGHRQIFPTKPNIIFVLMDDMGYADVSYNGASFKTTNIDKLANSGVILDNYYVQPLCAPTRSAIFTGRVPEVELGVNLGVYQLLTERGLPLREQILSEKIKQLGYTTHMVGKWHLGAPSWDFTPTFRGFDTFFGLLCSRSTHFTFKDGVPFTDHSNFYCNNKHIPVESLNIGGDGWEWGNCLFNGTTPIGWENQGRYGTHIFFETAVDHIRQHKRNSGPMFMFLSLAAVHAPWEAPDADVQSSKCSHLSGARQILCGMMQVVDQGMEKLVETLKKNSMLEDTVIVFSSDNGGWVGYKDPGNMWDHDQAHNNKPFRGGKGSFFEGGTRVAGFIWGDPVKRGSSTGYMGNKVTGIKNNDIFMGRDWFLTLQSIAGGDAPNHLEAQERNFWPRLISSYNQHTTLVSGGGPRDVTIYDINIREGVKYRGAIRNKKYKLIHGANLNAADGWFHFEKNGKLNVTRLCDSATDCQSLYQVGNKLHCMDDYGWVSDVNHAKCRSFGLGEKYHQYCEDYEYKGRGQLPAKMCPLSCGRCYQLLFKISEDPSEERPLKIGDLTGEDLKNYEQLQGEFHQWKSNSAPKLYPKDFTNVWGLRLNVQGLPRFWRNCSFEPYESTENMITKPESYCQDGLLHGICPGVKKSEWHVFAKTAQWRS